MFEECLQMYNYTNLNLKHFSAGIGRTGTFIGLHELTKHERKAKSIDVFKYANTMRNGRMNMIQTFVSNPHEAKSSLDHF